jgi:hypothetical protein
MSIQRKIIDILIGKLNEYYSPEKKFQEGYIYQETQNDFKFISRDPNNQFGVLEQTLIPTMFHSFIGDIEPNSSVYIEPATVLVEFALPIDGDFLDRLEDIEQFKRDVRSLTGKFDLTDKDDVTTTYYYKTGSTPINDSQQPITLNGVKVVKQVITIKYTVSDVKFGDGNIYEIRELKSSEPDEYETLAEIGRSMGLSSDTQPSQPVNNKQTTSTKGASVWSASKNIYSKNAPKFIGYLYEMLEKKETSSSKVFEYRMTLEDRDSVIRKVTINNLSYPDGLGTPLTFQFGLEEASQFLINKQLGG